MAEKVILGDFTFEIGPRRQIDRSSPRSIAKIDIPGKGPSYQDMGEDEHTISWGGTLDGDNAHDDIKTLEGLKGKEIKFLKGNISETVRIKEINYSMVRDDRVDYSISLVVMQAEAQLTTPATTQTGDSQIAPAASASPAPSNNTYPTVQGDTLWLIAQRELGNGNRWSEIADLNNITNPRTLGAGVVLKLPVA